MKQLILSIILVGVAVLVAQPSLVGAADAKGLEQRTQSFTINLKGSIAEVTPLFGPVREAEWAPSWKPRFLHPAQDAQAEGAVFTTVASNGKERLWLLTAYDVDAGRVEYVFIAPGFTANEIKILVRPDGDRQCKATITYRHSAIAPKGNEEVEKLSPQWAQQQRAHWETAVNAVLARRIGHD
jgi:hypothetical protein